MIVRASAYLLVLWISAAAVHAQTPILGPSKANAPRLRWLNYKMVGGRVLATSNYPGTNMTFGPSASDDRRHESLTIQITGESTRLAYELRSEKEKLAITFAENDRFSLERVCAEPALALRFEQAAGEPLQLTVDEQGRKRTLRAASFWHLYLLDPALVRQQLVPILEILHPSWQLASMGTAVEAALIERAQHPDAGSVEHWNRLIDELGSGKFSERENAQRELLSLGPVVVLYLQNLDRGRLDAEQVFRIRAVVQALSINYEDTPDRVATWLAGDDQVWLSLLDRDQPAQRRLAAAQLALLAGEAIDFDPLADEATRKAQMERLQARLRKPVPDDIEPAANPFDE